MSDNSLAYDRRPMIGLLLGVKVRAMRNRIWQAATDAPLRLSAAVIMIAVVWLGLYTLFLAVFHQFRRTPLEATVAIPLVFNFFFLAMLMMLTFSNAIIAYGALFGRGETAYLLTTPLTPLDVVTLKYAESVATASWSLLLLGLPLMLAMADMAESSMLAMTGAYDRYLFYAVFIVFFVAFIPIPGAFGLLLAWVCARFVPRRAMRPLAAIAGAAALAFVLRGMRMLHMGDTGAEVWLRAFLSRMQFVEATFFPNHWVAAGIDHVIQNKLADAFLYLGVTIANALFLSWLVVMLIARHFDRAHDRAWSGRGGGRRLPARMAGGLPAWIFFYLPRPLRLIAVKDFRTFLRDPLQWSQLVILLGLMVLYLTNMPTLRLQFTHSGWYLVIPFLNLGAVSLILATFTCRFVFPLVSLEGQKLWLVGLLPLPRSHILLAKFAFAMTVTLAVGVSTMGLAAYMLKLDPAWALIHLVIIVAACFGLCGLAVGIGARLPMFDQTNTARIANGLGGTTNLLASIALTAVVLIAVGTATWRSRSDVIGAWPDQVSLALCCAAVVVSAATGMGAMWLGARHFDRAGC